MTPSSADPWDLVVIGAGSAGLVAARTAAGLGRRVLLIDRRAPGGDCLWTGCVPSKALIAAADAAVIRDDLGIRGPREVDGASVLAHVRAAIAAIEPEDSVDALERDGVRVMRGSARFTGRTTVSLRAEDGADTEIAFRQAIIATGAVPVRPDLPGAEHVDLRTSEDLWDLETLPERLLVVGGGPQGCELAQAFARLGATVTLVQRADRVLPRETVDAGTLIAGTLRADGVDLRTGTTVESLSPGVARLSDGTTVAVDTVLAAVGRRPATADLGLAAAGVSVDPGEAVVVDDALRTSNPLIRAAGDATGAPYYTHTAGMNGSSAAIGAIVGAGASADRRPLRVTFTRPEVGAVGLPPDQADARHHRVVTIEHADVDRAVAEGRPAGFTRIVVDRRGRVRGAVVVSPRAGETIGEIALAIEAGSPVSRIARTTHPYPTFSDGFWNACIRLAREDLGHGLPGRAIGVLARIRSARVDRAS